MKIFFITPFAGYTGSEMMVKYVAQELRTRHQVVIGSNGQGTLFHDLDVPQYYLPHTKTLGQKIKGQLTARKAAGLGLTAQEYFWKTVLDREKPDLVVVNTTYVDHFDFFLKNPSCPFLVWAHELSFAVNFVVTYERMGWFLQNSQAVIACSEPVAQLFGQGGAKKVVKIYSGIDLSLLKPAEPATLQALRQHHGIGAEDKVLVMAGTGDYRKGSDYVLPLLQKLPENVKILWLGRKSPMGYQRLLENTLQAQGLAHRLIWAGLRKEDYYAHFQLADAFVLLSREDPFPLVMIEAAALGKPIVAFPSGGSSEFVQPGMGYVCERFDVAEMAQAIIHILTGQLPFSPQVSQQRAQEFDMPGISAQLQALFESYAR